MSGEKGRRNCGKYHSWADNPPRYDGPHWIGKSITPPPTGVGPGWIGKRVVVRSAPQPWLAHRLPPRGWME